MHTEPPLCSQGTDESAFNEQLCRQLQIPLFEPQPLSDGGPGRDASPERRPRGTTSKSASRAGRTTSWTPQDLRGGDSDCCSRAGSFESASSRRIQERPPPSPPLSGSPGRASRPLRRGASVATSARHIVSGNRRRFIEGGYDLDLSYITSNVIAMAFPGKSARATPLPARTPTAIRLPAHHQHLPSNDWSGRASCAALSHLLLPQEGP